MNKRIWLDTLTDWLKRAEEDRVYAGERGRLEERAFHAGEKATIEKMIFMLENKESK